MIFAILFFSAIGAIVGYIVSRKRKRGSLSRNIIIGALGANLSVFTLGFVIIPIVGATGQVLTPIIAIIGAYVLLFVTEHSSEIRREKRIRIPKTILFGLIGILFGGLIGFLLRPAAPLIGQLDFHTVLTRGISLHGADRLLISTAQTSFNYVIVGLLLGGGIGATIGSLFGKSQTIINKFEHEKTSKEFDVSDSKGSNSVDITEQIRKLSDLKNRGAITEEEFNTKKSELLKRL